MRIAPFISSGVASVTALYKKGRDLILNATQGALRIIADDVGSTDPALIIKRGAVETIQLIAKGQIKLSNGGTGSTAALQVANSSAAGVGYQSGTKIHTPESSTAALRVDGTDRVAGDDGGSRANGSQETDCLLYRSDGGSPPTYSLVRVRWVDGASIGAGNKVLVFDT